MGGIDLKKTLTRKQEESYQCILRYTNEHGYPPTVREFGKLIGVKSTSSAFSRIKQLEMNGSRHGGNFPTTNVPAKICPECGEITIHEIIQERIVQYATQRNKISIDYAECENEESVASQSIL